MDLNEAVVALQLVPGLGEKTLGRLLDGEEEAIRDVLSADEERLRRVHRLRPEAASFLARRRDRLREDAAVLMAALRRLNVETLHRLHPRYPEALKRMDAPPPLLYARGDLDLLDGPTVCFLASRGDADDPESAPVVLSRLRTLADRVAERGYPIVTGHNRDAYQQAALAAGRYGSPVLYVLDCGLLAALREGHDPPFAAARIHAERPQRRLYLSMFRPKDPSIGHNNRRRDRLITALAKILVVIEAREGGVMARECVEALNRRQRVVALAPEGRISPVHEELYRRGALLIQTAEEMFRHLADAGL